MTQGTVIRSAIAEQRILLHHISWQTFKQLLHESGEERHARFAYYQGTLEIMSPIFRHENINHFLDELVRIMTDEMNLGMRNAGSMTMIREELKSGAEPDSSYYIQNEPLVRAKQDIDLEAGDPPPDLVIEIDISTNSLDKLPIYASLNVPELWRFDGTTLQFLMLQTPEHYFRLVDCSPTFPWFSSDKLIEVLDQRLTLGEAQTQSQFRQWVREQISVLPQE